MNDICEHCGGPRPEAKGNRARKYCSDSCRTKAYQARRRAARLDFLDGVKPLAATGEWVTLADKLATDDRAALFNPELITAIQRLSEIAADLD